LKLIAPALVAIRPPESIHYNLERQLRRWKVDKLIDRALPREN